MNKKGYKELFVWRESIALVTDVYAILRDFPVHERFALCDQIRRAAVSVPANIAEGQAKYYRSEFLRHLRIARGSLAELHTLLIIAEQVGYMDPSSLEEFEQKISAVAKPLHRLTLALHGKTKEMPEGMREPDPEQPQQYSAL